MFSTTSYRLQIWDETLVWVTGISASNFILHLWQNKADLNDHPGPIVKMSSLNVGLVHGNCKAM